MTTPQAPVPATLRVGFVPGVILTKWRGIWADRFPGVPLETIPVTEEDQRRGLVDGGLDLCFVRLPFDAAGMHLIPLYEEQPVVWVAREHPIALFDEVTTADLAGERVLERADDAAIDLVVREEAVLRVPLSVARVHSRRDLVHRPVTDAPTTRVGLAWPIGGSDERVEEFIGVVRGRTANSARSAQERSARGTEAKPGKPARGAVAAGRRPVRGGRRKRR